MLESTFSIRATVRLPSTADGSRVGWMTPFSSTIVTVDG